jgi:multisubunit Na+/H+ antiporter MnhB subunit
MPMPMPMPVQPQQGQPNVAVALRMVLAILSLIFMIPLAAITTSAPDGGLAALFIVAGVVLGINFAFNRHR